MECPPIQALLDVAEGRSLADAPLLQHLASCSSCSALIGEARERARVAQAALTLQDSLPETPEMARLEEKSGIPFAASSAGSEAVTWASERSRQPQPAKIGRYLVLGRLGAGGMGEVFAAQDPELHRKVALKLLLPTAASAGSAEQSRLLREAQAMAQLSHQNVVPIYDAGSHGSRVFIAMELVEGGTLAQWLAETPRGWREIVTRFRQAGEGLRAAHAAGIVHRDFKPSNCLLAKDGRAQVSDFGLARFESTQASDVMVPGAMVGTPEYMAPEQIEGKPVDARADIFSFSASLYEALYGVRPFSAKRGRLALHTQIMKGEPAPPPRPVRVPKFLRKLVLRGLSPRAEDRFPSMDSLLRELQRDPGRTALRIFAGVSAAALVAGIILFSRNHALEAVRACGGSAAKLAGVWDGPRKQAASAAFQASGVFYAASSWSTTEAAIDAWTARWVAMRTEACEATDVRHEQSAELLDLRMACLDHRLRALAAKVELFTHADAEVVRNAPGPFEDLSRCADTRALRDGVRPPADPATNVKVAALRERLARAQALYDGGKYPEALALAKPISEEAHALGYKPFAAESGLLLGRIYIRQSNDKRASTTLRAAAIDAEAGHADAMAAVIWTQLAGELVWVDLRAAEETVALALGALERSGNDPSKAADLEAVHSDILRRQGKRQEALEHAQAGLALAEKSEKENPSRLAYVVSMLASALNDLGRSPEALAQYQRMLALDVRAFGPAHPEIAEDERLVSLAYTSAGDLEAARIHAARALEIAEKALGPDHARIASYAANLGHTNADLGDHAAAEKLLERAMRIAEQQSGANSDAVATVAWEFGYIERAAGNFAAARRWYERELAVAVAQSGPDSEDAGDALLEESTLALDQRLAAEGETAAAKALDMLRRTNGENSSPAASALRNLSQAALLRHRWSDALQFAQKALDGDDEPEARAAALTCIGNAQLGLEHPTEAAAAFEQALTLRNGSDRPGLALTRFSLARTLRKQGAQPERASALAIQARDAFRADGPRSAADLRDVELWLKAI